MSLVTGFKLQKEEYPSEVDWIERLLRPLNIFSQSTMNAVNGGLVIGQNVIATYKTARVKVPPVPWVDLPPDNATQLTGEAILGYYVDSQGEVYLRGAVQPTSNADGTVIFTMPDPNLYPETLLTLPLIHDHGSSHSYSQLSNVDGSLRIYNLSSSANTIYFNNITYFASTPPGPLAYTGPDWPIKLATDMPLTVKACFLAQVTDVDTNETFSVGVGGVHWEATRRDEIEIKRVEGLTPKRTYDLTFLLVGG